jgi:hypothetical protein
MDIDKVKALHADMVGKRAAVEKAMQFAEMLHQQSDKARNDAIVANKAYADAVRLLEAELSMDAYFDAGWRYQ